MPDDTNDYTLRLMRFLQEKLDLGIGEMPQSNDWAGTGNTIGAVSLRAGVLDVQQIDAIIDEQSKNDGLFGEIGCRLGYLDKATLECLLELQRFHRCLDLGAPLVLRGRVALPDLLGWIAEFFRSESGPLRVGDEPAGEARD